MAKKDKDKSEECSEIIEKKSDNKATNYFDSDYWRVNIDQRRSSIQQRDHIISSQQERITHWVSKKIKCEPQGLRQLLVNCANVRHSFGSA